MIGSYIQVLSLCMMSDEQRVPMMIMMQFVVCLQDARLNAMTGKLIQSDSRDGLMLEKRLMHQWHIGLRAGEWTR